MSTAASMSNHWDNPHLPTKLHDLFLAISDRHSSNPVDKVCAIAFPFQKRGRGNFQVTFPIYDPSTPVSVAWRGLISSIASAKMGVNDLVKDPSQGILRRTAPGLHEIYNTIRPSSNKDIFHHTTTIQLLCLFPHPSKHHWFPSWAQVLQYPDVSIRDNDPIPVARGMDYSLRILSGRIYRDCSLKLKHSPTPDGKAAYHCSMGRGSETVELVATVPGVELDINPRSTYVLVDISPDYSLWPGMDDKCRESWQGHIHPPIWKESVIIVCEEVKNHVHGKTIQATKHFLAIGRYHLRRVTTLYWNCPLVKFDRCWLPFEPSLEHTRSVVCGESEYVTSFFPPDTFYAPAVARRLIKKQMRGWGESEYRAYEVYLV